MRSTKTLSNKGEGESADVLWDEDALVARLVESLACAEDAMRRLEAEDEELPAGTSDEQLIANTGVLLLAASKVSSYAAVGPRIERVAKLLVRHARSPRVLRRVCLEPAMALEHATAHICLNRLDFYDPDFDAMLDLSVAAVASDGRERMPHRMLEREWLKQGWLFPEGLPRLRAGAQMAHCALACTMDLLAGAREDMCSFTRALMVLRDFNLYPRPLPRARETLLAEAEGMLARCLAEEDYALAAEVLMAWPLTGTGWSAAGAFGFRVVMRIPSPPDDRSWKYTMGLLAAVCLAPGRRPPVRLPAEATRGGVCAAVMATLQGVEAAWMRELKRVDTAEQVPPASFLLCVALQRAFARRQFGAMERVLREGRRLGIVPSPTGVQAAEMMIRVAQCGLGDSAEKGEEYGSPLFVEAMEAQEAVAS